MMYQCPRCGGSRASSQEYGQPTQTCTCPWTFLPPVTKAEPKREQFWHHFCKEDHNDIATFKGQACNWCGATEPKRKWVGLTYPEFEKMLADARFTKTDLMMIGACVDDIWKMIEAKLKEKNT